VASGRTTAIVTDHLSFMSTSSHTVDYYGGGSPLMSRGAGIQIAPRCVVAVDTARTRLAALLLLAALWPRAVHDQSLTVTAQSAINR
jgi:hypothetical protein